MRERQLPIPDLGLRTCLAALLLFSACAGSGTVAPAPALDSLSDLSLIRFAPESSGTMAIILTGDGGWRRVDEKIGKRLRERGVSLLGWNMPAYLGHRRTPHEVSDDLARIMRHYLERGVSRFLLIGYSRGADTLPFMASRLPADLSSRVAVIALLAPSHTAALEYHFFARLYGSRPPQYPVLPEIEALKGQRVLCIAGGRDRDAICRSLPESVAKVTIVDGSHHFAGGYYAIADQILAEASR
ncbi:MAG: AcvB/VirJ family lysyl-phosphatidylglycerol hydrolase [Thermoanaerobaculia bacterium]